MKSYLVKIAPQITYKDTNKRDAIPPGERLAITLRHLATGQSLEIHIFVGKSFESLKFLHRISAQSIGKIIPETCQAQVNSLSKEYFLFYLFHK